MKTLHLFLFADALGWNLVQKHKLLQSVAPNQHPCETLFGYSATCDPSILTGKPPHEHGHFSFFVKTDPKHSPFKAFRLLGWLPDKIGGYHKIRNRLSRYVAKYYAFTGYFQLYSVPFRYLPFLDYTEKRDIYEPGGINGGQETIFEHWKRSGKNWHRSDWRNGDAVNYAELEALIEKGDLELAYLFTAGLDATMHRYGPWSKEATEALHTFDLRVQALLKLAHEYYDRVQLAIFSDHGMTEVSQSSDLRLRCEALPLKYGTDYTAVWDSTMARFWFNKQSAKTQIIELLKSETRGRIVSDEQLEAWQCKFPDNRYGELFYVLDPGVLFVPSFLNMSQVPGMHGYAPEDIDSTASWLTNFKTEQPVNKLEDIYAVMQAAANTP
jgi:hypothetical protein